MTTSRMLLLILLAIVVLIIGWKMARAWLARASEEKWWPQELQHARLAFAERTFKTWRPIRLIARVDRGYRLNGKGGARGAPPRLARSDSQGWRRSKVLEFTRALQALHLPRRMQSGATRSRIVSEKPNPLVLARYGPILFLDALPRPHRHPGTGDNSAHAPL